jgi:hypothetical protein
MTKVAQARRIDATERLPGEHSILDEAREIFADPDKWIQQEHPMLGGRSPQKCIDAGGEQLVWDLLRSIKYVDQT